MDARTPVGTRIKRLREARHWTQQQLADKVRVDRKTVDNWENSRSKPRSSIGALEAVFGESLTEEPRVPAVVIEHADDDRVTRLWAIDTIPAHIRERFIFYLLRAADEELSL